MISSNSIVDDKRTVMAALKKEKGGGIISLDEQVNLKANRLKLKGVAIVAVPEQKKEERC